MIVDHIMPFDDCLDWRLKSYSDICDNTRVCISANIIQSCIAEMLLFSKRDISKTIQKRKFWQEMNPSRNYFSKVRKNINMK